MSIGFRLVGWLKVVVILSALCSLGVPPASAYCLAVGPWMLESPDVDVLFDGTVLELRDRQGVQVAVMQVHRVFKGQLPARIEVHHRQNVEAAPLESGQRYVLPVSRVNPTNADAAWATIGCGGELRDRLQHDGTLDGFGPGWPPKG